MVTDRLDWQGGVAVASQAPEPGAPCPASLQIASFTIVVQQLKNIYDAFFITTCDRCRGTGIVTCPHVSAARGSLPAKPSSLVLQQPT